MIFHLTPSTRTLGAVLLVLGLDTACQRPQHATQGTLTRAQEKVVGAHILAAVPALQNKTDASFEDKLTLLGWDITGETKKGDKLHLVLFWRCDQPVQGDWKMFVHLDWRGSPKDARSNADHYGVGDMYPVNQWKRGEIIRDEVDIEVPADWDQGNAQLFLGFFDPVANDKNQDRRFAVTKPGAATLEPDGRLLLGNVPFAAPPAPDKPAEPAAEAAPAIPAPAIPAR